MAMDEYCAKIDCGHLASYNKDMDYLIPGTGVTLQLDIPLCSIHYYDMEPGEYNVLFTMKITEEEHGDEG